MATFPDRLPHGSGASMRIDRTRLLLATRESMTVDDVATLLVPARLALEDAGEEPDGRRMARVNHTDTRFWVRSADREPLDDQRVSLVWEILGDVLAWIGPVYVLSGGLERRYGAPTLVGVNVVRPVGRCTLTPRARRRFGAAIEATPEAAGAGRSVASAGPGCG